MKLRLLIEFLMNIKINSKIIWNRRELAIVQRNYQIFVITCEQLYFQRFLVADVGLAKDDLLNISIGQN